MGNKHESCITDANLALQAYLQQLQENPLRTKMLTSGTLSGLQEFLASWIAKDRSKHGHYFTSRVPKMAVYGALVAAPLGHVMISILQKLFAGRTSLKAKILQILFSNLVVSDSLETPPRSREACGANNCRQISPIQNIVYLTSMAVIAGAQTFHQVRATVRAGFMPVMKVSWVTSPIALAFAQQFLPQETWVPFFNLIGFVIGKNFPAYDTRLFYLFADTTDRHLHQLENEEVEVAGFEEEVPGRPKRRWEAVGLRR